MTTMDDDLHGNDPLRTKHDNTMAVSLRTEISFVVVNLVSPSTRNFIQRINMILRRKFLRKPPRQRMR